MIHLSFINSFIMQDRLQFLDKTILSFGSSPEKSLSVAQVGKSMGVCNVYVNHTYHFLSPLFSFGACGVIIAGLALTSNFLH